jgi:hypothetical protein
MAVSERILLPAAHLTHRNVIISFQVTAERTSSFQKKFFDWLCLRKMEHEQDNSILLLQIPCIK